MEDSAIARVLVDELRGRGASTFLASDLAIGADWQTNVLYAIRRCDVFIGIIGRSNPNVMLETGYALGSNRKVVLVQSGEGKIPFDVASLPVITIDKYDRSSIAAITDVVENADEMNLPAFPRMADARSMLRALRDDPSLLDAFSPSDFEQLVFEFLRQLELDRVDKTISNDYGYDIRFEIVGAPVFVAIKKHSRNSRLAVSEIQKLIGAAVVGNAKGAMYITSGSFTNSAMYFAENSPIPIALFTLDMLIESDEQSIKDACTRSVRRL